MILSPVNYPRAGMISMEFAKKANLILIFFIGYLLFWNWQKDYGHLKDNTASIKLSHSTIVPGDLSVHVPDNEAMPSATLIKVKSPMFNAEFSTEDGSLVQLGLNAYPATTGNNTPFQLLSTDPSNFYILEQGFIFDSSQVKKGLNPFTCLNCSQAGMDTSSDRVIELVSKGDLWDVYKSYTFRKNSYEVVQQIKIVNHSGQPLETRAFSQIVRGNQKDPGSQSGMRISSFLGAAWWTPDKLYNKKSLDALVKGDSNSSFSEKGGWLAFVQHYFIVALIPDHNSTNEYSIRSENGKVYLSLVREPHSVLPGQSYTDQIHVFMGPKIISLLKPVSPGLDLTIDYGWLWPIAEFLFYILHAIFDVLGNWGWSIVVLTIIVKMAFWPLSTASYRSMAQMRKLAPEIERLKDKFGDDRQKMSQAMMEFYRKEKINPLGGCLPMVVQMPVFIALYWTLMESVELRHSSFIFWIRDLADMDHFFILPILMGLSMYIQQSLNPAPADPMQAKMMKFMPLIFTGFFLFFPSGLVLYWIVSNLISILQQWTVNQRINKPVSVA